MVDIKTQKEGEVDILEVSGEIDASSSLHLDNVLKDTFNSGCTKLVVDCSSLEYISSAGLGVFMSYIEELKEKNARMIIVGLSKKVKNVFNILGLDQLLEIMESREEGVSMLK